MYLNLYNKIEIPAVIQMCVKKEFPCKCKLIVYHPSIGDNIGCSEMLATETTINHEIIQT